MVHSVSHKPEPTIKSLARVKGGSSKTSGSHLPKECRREALIAAEQGAAPDRLQPCAPPLRSVASGFRRRVSLVVRCQLSQKGKIHVRVPVIATLRNRYRTRCG